MAFGSGEVFALEQILDSDRIEEDWDIVVTLRTAIAALNGARSALEGTR